MQRVGYATHVHGVGKVGRCWYGVARPRSGLSSKHSSCKVQYSEPRSDPQGQQEQQPAAPQQQQQQQQPPSSAAVDFKDLEIALLRLERSQSAALPSKKDIKRLEATLAAIQAASKEDTKRLEPALAADTKRLEPALAANQAASKEDSKGLAATLAAIQASVASKEDVNRLGAFVLGIATVLIGLLLFVVSKFPDALDKMQPFMTK